MYVNKSMLISDTPKALKYGFFFFLKILVILNCQLWGYRMDVFSFEQGGNIFARYYTVIICITCKGFNQDLFICSFIQHMLLIIHCIKLKKIKWLQSVFFKILFEMKKNHSKPMGLGMGEGYVKRASKSTFLMELQGVRSLKVTQQLTQKEMVAVEQL